MKIYNIYYIDMCIYLCMSYIHIFVYLYRFFICAFHFTPVRWKFSCISKYKFRTIVLVAAVPCLLPALPAASSFAPRIFFFIILQWYVISSLHNRRLNPPSDKEFNQQQVKSNRGYKQFTQNVIWRTQIAFLHSEMVFLWGNGLVP